MSGELGALVRHFASKVVELGIQLYSVSAVLNADPECKVPPHVLCFMDTLQGVSEALEKQPDHTSS